MLAVLLLGAGAWASPAVDYMDTTMQVDLQVAVLYLNYGVSVLGARPDAEKALAQAQTASQVVLQRARELEPWKGDDRGLSAAVTQRAEHAALFFEQTMPTLLALQTGPHPRDADQLQFETLLHLTDVTEIQDVDRINDALLSFAQANRVTLTLEPSFQEPPELLLDLPGRPSSLDALGRVNFAISHSNEMVLVYDEALAVWNTTVSLEPTAVLAQREELEQAVAQIKAVPPWMGDDTLTSALSANGDAFLSLYALLVEAAELDLRLFLFGKKRLRREALTRQVNEEIGPLDARADAAYEAFKEGWHMEACEQFAKELGQWAAKELRR